MRMPGIKPGTAASRSILIYLGRNAVTAGCRAPSRLKRTCSFGSSRKAPRNWVVTVSAPGLLDAAERHAGVLGLDHHGNAAGLQDLLDRGGDLGVHVLLGL